MVWWSLCISWSFCLPLEIQCDGGSAWTGNGLPCLKHQLVKYLHKILLFYKYYIVGTGDEACVPSQIDGELTSETAKVQEVLYLTWKGFSKRYEAMFTSKWQLFGLTSLTCICGLESSARATANNKCPENRDAFQSCFFMKNWKSSNCLIQVISLVRKWFMMGTQCMVLYTRSLKAFNGRAFSSPLSIYFSTRRNSDGASVKTNHLRAKCKLFEKQRCRSINSKWGTEQSVNRAVPVLFISLLNWVCHLHLTSRWPWLFNSNVWLCYK